MDIDGIEGTLLAQLCSSVEGNVTLLAIFTFGIIGPLICIKGQSKAKLSERKKQGRARSEFEYLSWRCTAIDKITCLVMFDSTHLRADRKSLDRHQTTDHSVLDSMKTVG